MFYAWNYLQEQFRSQYFEETSDRLGEKSWFLENVSVVIASIQRHRNPICNLSFKGKETD